MIIRSNQVVHSLFCRVYACTVRTTCATATDIGGY